MGDGADDAEKEALRKMPGIELPFIDEWMICAACGMEAGPGDKHPLVCQHCEVPLEIDELANRIKLLREQRAKLLPLHEQFVEVTAEIYRLSSAFQKFYEAKRRANEEATVAEKAK